MWAGWRSAYVSGEHTDPVPEGDGTIFERIFGSGLADEESYVLWRGESCGALLNVYPYSCGHLMVLPFTAAPDLLALPAETYTELWEGVRMAVAAIEDAYSPDGVNVGLNIGKAGGASIPGHLHVHCLPRWSGDTTFLTSIAEARMLPEPLSQSWQKLKAAWPEG
jgi:diadenosine tetraphosphate (Ap4A) HIT family hydrolase